MSAGSWAAAAPSGRARPRARACARTRRWRDDQRRDQRVIAANFGRMPKVAKAAQDNLIRGYNLPQGVISQLYRACAAGQPGLFSKVGLKTYAGRW
ncbi:hypothetical protein MMR14E_20150 [Methylobacterium mesophilicum]